MKKILICQATAASILQSIVVDYLCVDECFIFVGMFVLEFSL